MRVLGEIATRKRARPWPARRILVSGMVWPRAHWLALTNGLQVLILVGAVAAPLLVAAGLEDIAAGIHRLYLLLCPQRPEHSYFLLGHQLALEHREIAMFAGQIAGGLLYAKVRNRQQVGLNSWIFVLLSIPLVLDIVTQMLQLRSSDWFTRSWTAAVFSVACAFWLYPRLEHAGSVSSRRRR